MGWHPFCPPAPGEQWHVIRNGVSLSVSVRNQAIKSLEKKQSLHLQKMQVCYLRL